MKRFFLALSLLTLTACQAQPLLQTPGARSAPGQATFQARNTGSQASAQWFEQLSPDLQNYYAEARGKSGHELFQSLNRIVSRAKMLDYGPGKSYIYAVAENHERGNKTGIMTAYSELFIPGSGGNGGSYREQGDSNGDGKSGDFINCEHTWPQSFFEKREPMRSDLHHLFPTLSVPNNRRGHHPFGMASEGKVAYSTSNGTKLALRGRALSYSNVGALDFDTLGKGEAVFEPANVQKGNTARAMMYFYLRFYNQNIRNGDYDAADFWLQRLEQFRQWSNQDPVNELEQRRNQLIAEKQGNRNPFIDIPGLIDLIGVNTIKEVESNFR